MSHHFLFVLIHVHVTAHKKSGCNSHLLFLVRCKKGTQAVDVMHLQLHNLLHVDGDGLDVGVLLQLGLHQSELSIAAASDQ